MLTKFLGILDIISAFVIIGYAILPHKFVVYAAFYLLFKGFLFATMGDCFLSVIDIFIGLYTLFLSFGVAFGILTAFCMFFLLIKGTLSLF